MGNFALALIVLIAIFLIVKFLKDIEIGSSSSNAELENNDTSIHYVPKKFILSSSEFAFYKVLRAATEDRFIISPQVHLSGLFAVRRNELQQKTYLSKIDKKSVDFVLFDKDTMVALLAIELDDYSHTYDRRHKRDDFVNRLFFGHGLKLLRIRVQPVYDVVQIRTQITQLITTS